MKKELLNLIKREAVFKKRTVLSSGKISNYYIDIRRISLTSKGLFLISSLIWDMVKKDNPTAVGGPTLGADPIVGGICLLAYNKKKKIKGFIVRKKPKKHGRQNLIEGKPLTYRDRVVIVDDVTTTGSSLINAYIALKEYKIKVIKAISVVDREEGAKEAFKKVKCPFTSIFSKKDFI